jgi:hypothetical protein
MAAGDVGWSAGTTSIRPYTFTRTPYGFAVSQSTVFLASTYLLTSNACDAGYCQVDEAEIIRIPFVDNRDMMVTIKYVGLDTAGRYPGIILRKPPQSKNPGSTKALTQPSSTNNSGYRTVVGKVSVGGTATTASCDFYIRIPPGRFAFNDGGSTGEGTAAYENYIEIAPLMASTAGNTAYYANAAVDLVSAACTTAAFNYAFVKAYPVW